MGPKPLRRDSRKMSMIFRVCICLLAFAGAAEAGGEWGGSKDGFYSEGGSFGGNGPLFYAKACYWHRGTRYCRLYCYVEINGKHYCNERESRAVPQGDPYKVERPTVDDIYRRQRPY
jgi:hypothetical protein